MKYEFTPEKIIYNGVATVVFWDDGTKTVVKRSNGTKDDKYNAFCAALAKKVFGTNSKLKNCIKEAENAEPLKVGDRVRILDGSNIPDYAGEWVDDMKEEIGKIRKIESICDTFIRLKGSIWVFDARGLKKV